MQTSLTHLLRSTSLAALAIASLACEGEPNIESAASASVGADGSAWAPTGALAASRSSPAATRLADGRILLTGGMFYNPAIFTYDYRTSAEIYSPSTRTWRTVGSMGSRRYRTPATLLRDGRVFIIGGVQGGDHRAELFSPATETWSFAAPPLYQHFDVATALLSSGEVFVTSEGNSEVYSPTMNTWRRAARAPFSVYEGTATRLNDGRVLVISGDLYAGVGAIYDPVGDTWTAVPSMSVPRYGHTATLLTNGRVLITGGGRFNNGAWTTHASAVIFNPATGAWSSGGTMTIARSSHRAVRLSDGRVLVAGGVVGGRTTELFDPSTLRWTRTADLEASRTLAALLSLGTGALIAGGDVMGAAQTSAEVYQEPSPSSAPVR